MSNDELMDEQLRRFLDWQAGQLEGTPDARDMALRLSWRSGARKADRPRLVWAIVVVALIAALVAVATLVGSRLVERPPDPALLLQPSPASALPTVAPSSTAATASPGVPTVASFVTGSLLDEAGKAVTGQLDPGTYAYMNVDGNGFNVRFTVPVGWTWNGRYLSKGGIAPLDGAAVFFYGGPVQAYADPCHWASVPSRASGSAGFVVATLMADLAAQPKRYATSPIVRYASGPGQTTSASVPGRWPGMSVQLTVPNDIDLAGCDEGQYRSWGPENNARRHQGPLQHDLVWAVDLVGNGVGSPSSQSLVIDAATFPATPARIVSEIDAMLESMVMCHCG